MADFLDLMVLRQSCRRFTDQAVSESDLKTILKAAQLAPIGSSRYDDIHLTVVQNRAILHELTQALQERLKDRKTIEAIIGSVKASTAPRVQGQDPFYGAGTVIFVSHREQTLQPGIEFSNVATVVLAMQLEATSLGLGSVFMWGVLEAMRVIPHLDNSHLLKLPTGFKPLLGLAVGYPAMEPREKSPDIDRIGINYIS